MSSTFPVSSQTILGNRYQIIQQLGNGGFGKVYLAKDQNRYSELCVLKEFAPQLQNNSEFPKAEELFQREAGVLYKLNHNQIPKFRELFKVNLGGKESLFLVQDYVQGQSFWQLSQQGKCFSEQELTQLLLDILPVLDYIHNQSPQVIHRDISPDNIIRRDGDGKPVLVDFGCVKEVAARVTGITGGYVNTLIGKKGYSPPEQLHKGKAFPSSDLYSLAVTILVLLTGKAPQELYDSYQANWNFQGVNISPKLKQILTKMVAHVPSQRYQSAREVLDALGSHQIKSEIATQIVSPENRHGNSGINTQATVQLTSNGDGILSLLKPAAVTSGVVLAFLLPGALTFQLIRGFFPLTLPSLPEFSFPTISLPTLPELPQLPSVGESRSSGELRRVENIHQRRQALDIDESRFNARVNARFYQKYPQLRDYALTSGSKDAQYRNDWYDIAEDLLEQQEAGRRVF